MADWWEIAGRKISLYIQYILAATEFNSADGDSNNGRMGMAPRVERRFREVEVDTVAKFMEDIQAVTMQVNQQDSWEWRLDPWGVYTVASAYKVLASQLS